MNKYAPWIFVAVLLFGSVLGLFALVKMQAGVGAGATLSVPVSASDWQRGATSTAKVTLVEYTDFQCPACGAYYPLIKQIEEAFPDTLALVVRHYPLPQHKNALNAAHAAEAAGKQGKFWEMYDTLFSHQIEWSELADPQEQFLAYAKAAGIDQVRLKADIASGGFDTKINADKASGDNSGVLGTPSFYVNGTKINNPDSVEAFKKIISDAAAQ